MKLHHHQLNKRFIEKNLLKKIFLSGRIDTRRSAVLSFCTHAKLKLNEADPKRTLARTGVMCQRFYFQAQTDACLEIIFVALLRATVRAGLRKSWMGLALWRSGYSH